eukprot:7154977-Prymnesium_polylepis.1
MPLPPSSRSSRGRSSKKPHAASTSCELEPAGASCGSRSNHICRLRVGRFSTTVTAAPSRWATSAAGRPAGPAPTTMTSSGSACGCARLSAACRGASI